jgi:iron complex transport system permease protein
MMVAPSLSVLSLGEQVARGLGQSSRAVRLLSSIVVLVLAGGAVAVAGPIGFVGLIVPHAVRALVGLDCRLVIPGSALGGAILMLAADLGAHWATAPLRTPVPVGVVTAMLGVPCFLYLAGCRPISVGTGLRRKSPQP